jgi:endoglucanase
MHTPSEVLCLSDIEATIDLVCAFCRSVRPDTDLTPW